MSQDQRTYEAMFLVDAGQADFDASSEPVRNVLRRHEVEILSIKPWDERKLAYGIRGRRRGLYILTYVKADPSRVTEVEHDCQLDEQILRVLVLQRPRLTAEQIDAETPATASARRAAELRAPPEEPAPSKDAPESKGETPAEEKAPSAESQDAADQPQADAEEKAEEATPGEPEEPAEPTGDQEEQTP